MALTKRDLVVRISKETGLVQTQVFGVMQKTLDYIAEALAKGDKVELRNFGVFEVKIRKGRVGRNPKQPDTDVPIPPRATVKFKAGTPARKLRRTERDGISGGGPEKSLSKTSRAVRTLVPDSLNAPDSINSVV